MILDLNKDEIISLIKGSSISYKQMDIPKIKWCGNYMGGFVDEWRWNDERLRELTEDQLMELYKLIKE